MGLFQKKQKETCCCGGDCNNETMEKVIEKQTSGVAVKILGGGCTKCNELEANTLAALEKLGVSTEIDHVRDFVEIASYGVMTTPALVYNGKVISFGKVLKTDEIVALLQKEM